jgi:cytochrome c oxidase subunit 4
MSHAHAHAHIDKKEAGIYVGVLVALLILTVVTVGASYINFGTPAVNVVVALGIASMKGTLVALYFMHLRHDSPVNAFIFVVTLLFLALFLTMCVIDTGSRPDVRPSGFKGYQAMPMSGSAVDGLGSNPLPAATPAPPTPAAAPAKH